MNTDELLVGRSYDVETSDGTVYEDAAVLEVTDDGAVVVSVGIAVVFIAPHEYADAEEVTGG